MNSKRIDDFLREDKKEPSSHDTKIMDVEESVLVQKFQLT